jgi:hypothetical protein
MKELNEDYHFRLKAFCDDCAAKEVKEYMSNFAGAITGRGFESLQQQIEEKNEMYQYSRAFHTHRFECKKCGKLLYVEVKELEEKWEKIDESKG